MAQAKQGDTVRVHYTGKLDDGTVFDSSLNREPLQFTIGESRIIPGFEEAVVGMNVGESKTVRVPMEKAYGPHRQEMMLQVDRRRMPPDFIPRTGEILQIRQGGQARPILVRVVGFSDTTVTLDANHPLAGKDLTFEITLVEII